MAKRGRKSSTSVAVLPPVDPAEIESIARPEPPECLDVSACDVWLDVVENLPADWFEPVMLPSEQGLEAVSLRHFAVEHGVLRFATTWGPVRGCSELERAHR